MLRPVGLMLELLEVEPPIMPRLLASKPVAVAQGEGAFQVGVGKGSVPEMVVEGHCETVEVTDKLTEVQ